MNTYHIARRLIAVLLLLTCLTATISYAEDFADDLTQNADALEADLEGLNAEARQLATELSAALSEIEQVSAELKETKEALSLAKCEEKAQYETMQKRIRYMYENDPAGMLEVLFTARSMADFLNRITFMAEISEYDNNALKELTETRKNIAKKEQELMQKQQRLTNLQETLREKEAALYGEISMTKKQLASYQNRIAIARANAEAAENTAVTETAPTPSDPEEPKEPASTPSDNTSHENVAASDLELFAALIECEAGSTNYEGMLAVASVVVNRMNSSYYPNTLRGVIYQSGQFPPATNGLVDNVLKRGIKNSCRQAAEDALAGKNNVGSCLSFRASSSGHAGKVIGSNVFF